jgi:hypothetical protein
MDDAEFLSLDLEGAREYILAYATDIKRYEKEIADLDRDVALWGDRAKLAEGKAAADLAAAASQRYAELRAKREALESERASLAAELVRLRERLPYLKARERSVDADLLLAELQSMTGELLDPEKVQAEHELSKVETEAKADLALAELKKKMGGSTA